ncbi:hypothetical protein DFP93_102350 [Aneurinibacillus soli]|uniref:Uncharacterized protein n=1 Tax=Aneurinibacillus soli TaxID=1500254 RepID=A0A0U5B910_9BACL|nr:hypothetical protein [Aneurinibacillus soli]PYE63663.1 hypothetical protein DFP93_102350 [Aneurinibacillus soli]BAU27404.1 hypothetical protein CB4_01578 [Aneurinibacillus soli]
MYQSYYPYTYGYAAYPSYAGWEYPYGERAYSESEEEDRNTQDVTRVMNILHTHYGHLYQELTRLGMDYRLVNYLFRSIVVFVDETYDRYTGTIDQKITQAERALRRQRAWIFDIMSLYAVSPATQARVLDTILRVSFQFLRPAPGPGHGPGHPGPGPMPR